MRTNTRYAIILFPLFAMLMPVVASAHEVYVLSSEQITYALGIPPFDMLQVILNNLNQFIFWAFIAFVLVSTVFFVSIFRTLERRLDPIFKRGKRYAHAICRVTVALGLLAGAYYQAAYGPELPLASIYGTLTPIITALIVCIGLLMLLGIWVRLAAGVAIGLFAVAVYFHGVYMLTYVNYLAEFAILFLIGTFPSNQTVPPIFSNFSRRVSRAVAPYSFALIRIAFGISFFYSSLFAKILHNNLALAVAQLPLAGHPYGVAHYFGFEPHFLVLGAAIIELVMGTFFILGIEIRWTCLFLEFWLALSLWWFGESVWPHLILIGIPIALFFYGYDRFTIEGRFFKKKGLEPVL